MNRTLLFLISLCCTVILLVSLLIYTHYQNKAMQEKILYHDFITLLSVTSNASTTLNNVNDANHINLEEAKSLSLSYQLIINTLTRIEHNLIVFDLVENHYLIKSYQPLVSAGTYFSEFINNGGENLPSIDLVSLKNLSHNLTAAVRHYNSEPEELKLSEYVKLLEEISEALEGHPTN